MQQLTEQEHRKMLQKIAVETYEFISRESVKLIPKDKFLAEDLAQDIVEYILTYPNNTIIEAYVKNQHLFFIRRMLKNQVRSEHSQFYYNYIKHKTEDIEDYLKFEEGKNGEE